MISSLPRRLVLSLLLGGEALYLALVVPLLVVPWDVTFSAFDGRPVDTLQAYVRAVPYLAGAVAATGALIGLWVRSGRAGRRCVFAVGALHAAGAAWFLAESGAATSHDVLVGAAMLAGYGAVLGALAWPVAPDPTPVRSTAS